ncbi:PiggyBac transposable element-derived protein 4 [Amphibalanus amphitrite]|uniref:PiggyBac transposable element-derived protein 4 n=1 Tax=Amphibalanus amphitrite TaxID=1232801 RepID=A0A6A4W7K6_AMPAM|nr:PiggyBac transposable element-derived protein 4 [Amphibalanus amphitrite]
MLESIVHCYPALTTMAGVADREMIRHMEELEKEELRAVVSLLGFFDDASKQLSASKQPTRFLVPLIVEQSRRHLQPDAADRPLVKKLKVKLLRGTLGDNFEGTVFEGDSHHPALALHLRYRRLAQLTYLDEETRSCIQELVKTGAAALFIRRAKSKTQSAVAAVSSADSTAPTAAAAAPFSLELESEDGDADSKHFFEYTTQHYHLHNPYANRTTREERQRKDEFSAIREVIGDSEFNETLTRHYNPSDCITVDETLRSFRGRCGFITFMPNKSSKYGLLIRDLADDRSRYMLRMLPYAGVAQDPDPDLHVTGAASIVKHLVAPFKNSGRNVTADRFYTTIALCEELLEQNLTHVGTAQANRLDLPEEAKTTTGREH